jgi:hypothetical protein
MLAGFLTVNDLDNSMWKPNLQDDRRIVYINFCIHYNHLFSNGIVEIYIVQSSHRD